MKSVYNKIVRYQTTDINLNEVQDTNITTPTNNQALVFNGSEQKWKNTTLSTTQLSNFGSVGSGPANGQFLKYNSTTSKWENATGVTSVHGRSGAITGQPGDYNIGQITGLDLTSPADRQILIHNGTSWINRQPTENIAYNMQVVNTVSITMAVNTTYLSTNCVLTLPTSANVGDTIKVMVADALNTTVTFPAGIYLVYAGAHLENFSMTVNTGSITLVYYRTNTWWAVSIGGVWSSTHGFVKNFRSGYSELNDIKNVSITSPTNNQMLKYNGTNWVNFTDYETNYVALSDNSSITGVPNTTYVLTNSTLIMPVGAFGETIKVVVNGVVNSWITFGSGTNYVYNGTTYSSRTINSNTGSITFQCYSGSFWWPTSIGGTWTNL